MLRTTNILSVCLALLGVPPTILKPVAILDTEFTQTKYTKEGWIMIDK